MAPVSERESREAFARRNSDYDDPGAAKMWFGQSKGERLDKLTEYYRRCLLRTYREGSLPWMKRDFEDYKIIHDRFLEKLDETQSPMSTKIWFGQFEGHEMRRQHNAPLRWKWLIDQNIVWKSDLEEIEVRYEKWMEKRTPRKVSTTRSAPVIVNPKGEKLGSWDEEPPPSTNESYERDSFCISDNEEISTQSESADTPTENIESMSGVENSTDDHDRKKGIPSRDELTDTSGNSQESSRSSVPTLEEVQTRRASRSGVDRTNANSPAIVHPAPRKKTTLSEKNNKRNRSDNSGSEGSDKENGSSRTTIQLATPTSRDDNSNDKIAPNNKRKHVAMMDLGRPASQSTRHHPKTVPPTSDKKRANLSAKQRSSRKGLSQKGSNDADLASSSPTNRQKSLTPYLQSSSEVIVVESQSSDDSMPVVPPSKRRKRGTQAPQGGAAFISR